MKSRRGLFAALFAASSLLVAVVYFATPETQRTEARDSGFKQQVRNALNEIGIDSSDRTASIDNLSAFMSYRAGILLSDARQAGLAEAESAAASNGKSISKEELASILTSVSIERFSALTDAELETAVDALRGFDHPDLPAGFVRGREYISLRANGQGRMRAEELHARLNSFRGSATSDRLTKSLVANAITLEIERVCEIITDADQDFFLGPKCGMSPAQAMLVAYAVVTDDLLAGNRAEIFERMKAIEAAASTQAGARYPDPLGHAPYGRNGYIFSTPADVLLTDSVVDDLINRLNEAIN